VKNNASPDFPTLLILKHVSGENRIPAGSLQNNFKNPLHTRLSFDRLADVTNWGSELRARLA
jgi:hypothetical protein